MPVNLPNGTGYVLYQATSHTQMMHNVEWTNQSRRTVRIINHSIMNIICKESIYSNYIIIYSKHVKTTELLTIKAKKRIALDQTIASTLSECKFHLFLSTAFRSSPDFFHDQMGKPSGGIFSSSHCIASIIRSSGTIRCRKDQVFAFHLAPWISRLFLDWGYRTWQWNTIWVSENRRYPPN